MAQLFSLEDVTTRGPERVDGFLLAEHTYLRVNGAATAVATAATTTAATTGNIVDLPVKVGIASLGYVCVTVIDKINYLSVVLTQNCAVELLPKLTVDEDEDVCPAIRAWHLVDIRVCR
eukprot:COSAG03_NODE_160_length_11366_cov_10.057518_8_plen_119_part_00